MVWNWKRSEADLVSQEIKVIYAKHCSPDCALLSVNYSPPNPPTTTTPLTLQATLPSWISDIIIRPTSPTLGPHIHHVFPQFTTPYFISRLWKHLNVLGLDGVSKMLSLTYVVDRDVSIIFLFYICFAQALLLVAIFAYCK